MVTAIRSSDIVNDIICVVSVAFNACFLSNDLATQMPGHMILFPQVAEKCGHCIFRLAT